jgi:NAD(P)-dependent dehydrogenase (short-subunit alcohol dehydrogenase family)
VWSNQHRKNVVSKEPEVALIIGGGPGISASCARLFSAQGMRVAIAARDINKSSLQTLAQDSGITLFACDASDAVSVASLFDTVNRRMGPPRLVVHNIDGRPAEVFRKSITEVDPAAVLTTLLNSTYSAFLVGQQAARTMLTLEALDGHKGTILFTNASAALKGFARSGAFAAASHGKAGLAQSMARELMPQGIHVAHIPIDAAIGWEKPDGTRSHRLAGETRDDNMAHPDRIADVYLQLHRQHRSTWAYEIVLRPWTENW